MAGSADVIGTQPTFSNGQIALAYKQINCEPRIK